MSDNRDVFRHVEAELYAYPYREKEIARLRDEVYYPYTSSDENVGGGKNNLIGDPTARKALKIAGHERLMHLERVAAAIEQIYDRLPEAKREFVRVKYWTKPQKLTAIGICSKLEISDRTFTRWRKQIVYGIAEKLGWK